MKNVDGAVGGTGSLVSQVSTISGTAEIDNISSGSLEAQAATVSGTAVGGNADRYEETYVALSGSFLGGNEPNRWIVTAEGVFQTEEDNEIILLEE